MLRYIQKLQTFAKFAHDLEDLSVCKRHKTGVVVFDVDCTRVEAVGYNGPPSGADHDRCTGEVGKCGCLHAEINALIKLKPNWPLLMYSTVKPCFGCADAIINAQCFVGVIWGRDCRHEGVHIRLSDAGILWLITEDLRRYALDARDGRQEPSKVTHGTLQQWRDLGARSRRIAFS